MSTQVIVQKEMEKDQKYIKTLPNVNTALAGLKVQLAGVQKMQEDGESLPEGIKFPTFDAWIEDIEKKIKSRLNAILRIDKTKALIVAYDVYLKSVKDEDEEDSED